MGAAFFYHLTSSSAEATLPMLISRARAAGWRVELRGTDAMRMAALDDRLWMIPDDGFLPHAMAGGAQDAEQPVLLTLGQGADNQPDCVMCIDRAEISAEEVTARERICIVFDGHDPDALAHARSQWKALTQSGCAAQYWSEESGRWEKKAETASA